MHSETTENTANSYVEFVASLMTPVRNAALRMQGMADDADIQAKKERMDRELREQLEQLSKHIQNGYLAFQESAAHEPLDRWTKMMVAATEKSDLNAMIQGVPEDIYHALQVAAFEKYEKHDNDRAQAMYAYLAALRPADVKNQIMLLNIVWREHGVQEAAEIYWALGEICDAPGFLYFGADCLHQAGRWPQAIDFLHRARGKLNEIAEGLDDQDETTVRLQKDVEEFLRELS